VAKYDASRAYLYNVNPRGLIFFDKFPSALKKLEERGSAPEDGVSSIAYVPADPEIPIPPVKKVKLSGAVELKNRRNFWVPRYATSLIEEKPCTLRVSHIFPT